MGGQPPPPMPDLEAEKAQLAAQRQQLAQESVRQQQEQERQERQRQELAQEEELVQKLDHERTEKIAQEEAEKRFRTEEEQRCQEVLQEAQEAQRAKEAALQQQRDELTQQEAELDQAEAARQEAEEAERNYTMAPYQIHENFSTTKNIGIAGEVSVGKSSLMNRLRDLKARELDAAPVGVNQVTMQPEKYAFPSCPDVRLWDLPGCGTPDFPRDSYARNVGLRHYDCLVYVLGGPFTDTAQQLMEHCQEHSVTFLVVRNKMDEAVEAANADFGNDAEATMQDITEALVQQGVTKLYLVSCRACDAEFSQLSKLKVDLRAAVGLDPTI